MRKKDIIKDILECPCSIELMTISGGGWIGCNLKVSVTEDVLGEIGGASLGIGSRGSNRKEGVFDG